MRGAAGLPGSYRIIVRADVFNDIYEGPNENNNDRAFTGIGATFHALILVDVNVRPAQAADFVLGWFGIDVLDDDTCKPRRNKDL